MREPETSLSHLTLRTMMNKQAANNVPFEFVTMKRNKHFSWCSGVRGLLCIYEAMCTYGYSTIKTSVSGLNFIQAFEIIHFKMLIFSYISGLSCISNALTWPCRKYVNICLYSNLTLIPVKVSCFLTLWYYYNDLVGFMPLCYNVTVIC